MKLKLIALLLLGAVAITALIFRENIQAFFAPDERPNIVLIYTDDIDCEQVFFDWNQEPDENGDAKPVAFPTLKQMADEGLSFTNFHVTTPVCGPSRACLYSGNYAHRNNFRVNDPSNPDALGFSGGFEVFDRENEIGHWMQETGYRTAFVGKYIHHGFEPDTDNGQWWDELRPMGWDDCIAHLSSKYFASFWTDFKKFKTEGDEIFRTDQEVEHCCEVWGRHHRRSIRKPLFLCWAPLAAHNPYLDLPMVAPRHVDWEISDGPTQEERFRTASAEGTGHPCMDLPNLSQAELDVMTTQWRTRMKSIKALDEGLAKLREELKASGELENTIFIFTSDHGYSHGAHRHVGKRLPYDRVTKVPFLVCGPGVPKGKTCDALLANIDIAPTMVGLAGKQPPTDIDGKNFSRLFKHPDSDVDLKRDGIVIENWEIENSRGEKIPAAYVSLRTKNHIYTEWAGGEREYYDLSMDPDQLNNLYSVLDEEKKAELWEQLHSTHVEEQDPWISETPTVDFIEPLKHGFVRLSGFAEDDKGIEKVEVLVHEKNNNVFWDGQTWQKATCSAEAILHSERGIISTWEYGFWPDNIETELEVPELDLEFSIGATDLQGNTTWKKNVLAYKCLPDEPETWIDSPVEENIFTSPVLIEGRAVDNKVVKEVRLVLRDMAAKKYWNGVEWTDKLYQIGVPFESAPDESYPFGENMVKYSYDFRGEVTQQVFVAIRAYDENSKFDESVASRSIWHPSLDKKKEEPGEEDAGEESEEEDSAKDDSGDGKNEDKASERESKSQPDTDSDRK